MRTSAPEPPDRPLFVLDENFPEPILRQAIDTYVLEVEVRSIREFAPELTGVNVEDWQVISTIGRATRRRAHKCGASAGEDLSEPPSTIRRMAVTGVRSLDVVIEEVRLERAALLTHFDAVETKAGVVLGFAGAIVALSTGAAGILAEVGRWASVLAGVLALASFWPRKFWSTDLQALRVGYLAAEPEFARLRLLDSQIVMAGRTHATLVRKVLLLKMAMATLGVAVVLSALGPAVS